MYEDYYLWHKNAMYHDECPPKQFCNLFGHNYSLDQIKEFLDYNKNSKGEIEAWGSAYSNGILEYYNYRLRTDWMKIWKE